MVKELSKLCNAAKRKSNNQKKKKKKQKFNYMAEKLIFKNSLAV